MIEPDLMIGSRRHLLEGLDAPGRKVEAEGGCGVLGAACSEQIEGRYLFPSLLQMKNRGNGKGGGVALVGLDRGQMGVPKELLEEDYLLQVAYIDESAREKVEREMLYENYEIHDACTVESIPDYRELGLEVRPPTVGRYFVRAKESALKKFVESNRMFDLPIEKVEDELVYQTSFRLNRGFYSSLGQKRAFVLSHGKNLMVLKLVGYGDDVIRYYKLEDVKAYVWIGHHRYPTKGKVWHPGGAHPFIGLHQALVHNGDFSNYHSMVEYLAQRNMYPLFLTDTEVAALLFDLWSRTYGYDMERLLEAMAPTTERDFGMLSEEKRKEYRTIQTIHINGSPDGPWFFIVAGNDPYRKRFDLIGITDTSMLRPQVFALQDDRVQIGAIASERQAIDALLEALERDGRIPYRFADRYWNARGGSWTDGGAFIFSLPYSDGVGELICTDKFGRRVTVKKREDVGPAPSKEASLGGALAGYFTRNDVEGAFDLFAKYIAGADLRQCVEQFDDILAFSRAGDLEKEFSLRLATMLFDGRYKTGNKKRAQLLHHIDACIGSMLDSVPRFDGGEGKLKRVDLGSRDKLRSPGRPDEVLVIDSANFGSEGNDSLARFLVTSHGLGWRNLVVYGAKGQRFLGSGLGPKSSGLRIDVYGDSGDYLASGLDGASVHVHGSAQDQVANIMGAGELVVHGDVGQTFMYSSKGGEAFVLGNAAGRPLINAVGSPRVVINGTCLDYLAESFMAGDYLNGGGFVILNGIKVEDGRIIELDTPYPGGNLFSLASGGAIFIRDPKRRVEENQLLGGRIMDIDEADWRVVNPMLERNERHFGIKVEDLLKVDGALREPSEVYRKVVVLERPKELE